MSAEDEAAKAVAALTRQITGLEKAANEAGMAATHAGTSVGQAQSAGFTRVAENLSDVRGQIERLAQMLLSASEQVKPGQAAAAGVTGETTPEQAVSKLTVTVAAVAAAHASVAAAVQETGSLETQVGQALRGALPGPLMGMLREVRAAATAADQQGLAGKKHVEAGIAQAGQIGAGGSGKLAEPGGSDTVGQAGNSDESSFGELESPATASKSELDARWDPAPTGRESMGRRALTTGAEYGPGLFTMTTTVYSVNYATSPAVGTGIAVAGWFADVASKRILKRLRGNGSEG